jgi:hypothetical protein
MQIRLIDTSIAYFVDNSLRTASEGEVVTDLPDTDAQRLIDAGNAELVEEQPQEVQATVAKRGKRGA